MKDKILSLFDILIKQIYKILIFIFRGKYGDYQDPSNKRNIFINNRKIIIMDHLSKLEFTSCLDLGSNLGFYSINIAKKFNVVVLGFEKFLQNVIKSNLEVQNQNLKNCFFFQNDINQNSIKNIPDSDITLVLSIFHHWVNQNGLDDTLKMMKEIISKNKKYIFFELCEDSLSNYINDEKDEKELLGKIFNRQEVLYLGSNQIRNDSNIVRKLYLIKKTL